MNNLIIIAAITVSILIVILLFKLNKTKIEYDNKLLVLNRKVRDITNLVDLSNTKNKLINEELNGTDIQNVTLDVSDNTDNGINTQYQTFVKNNGNFFDNLDNYNGPLPQEVKNEIDNLVNVEHLNESELMDQMNTLESELMDQMNTEGDLAEVEVEAEVEAEGDLVEAEVDLAEDDLVEAEVDLVESDLVESDLVESDLVEGDLVEVKGDLVESDLVESDLVESDLVEGDLVESDLVEGDLVEGDLDDDTGTEISLEQLSQVNDLDSDVNFNDLDAMSVKSLQDICRKYKLKVKGRKDELIDRIKEFLSVDKL
jgi:uncharacterized protein YjbI with pentapeptide repeats